MKRRSFLELLGLSGILPFVGTPEVAPPITVSQTPTRHDMSELHSYTLGSAVINYGSTLSGTICIAGTREPWLWPGSENYQTQLAIIESSQLYGGRGVPVLGGFDDNYDYEGDE